MKSREGLIPYLRRIIVGNPPVDDEISRLRRELELASKRVDESERDLIEAADRIAELEEIFSLRWRSDMRAIERWQKEAPGRELKWPDHVELVVWLLEKLEAANDPDSDAARRESV